MPVPILNVNTTKASAINAGRYSDISLKSKSFNPCSIKQPIKISAGAIAISGIRLTNGPAISNKAVKPATTSDVKPVLPPTLTPADP